MLLIRGLAAGYGDNAVLHGVDLAIREGEIVTLIGANGAGKTTLLKTISGLIKPMRGTIEFEGVRIARRAPHRIVKMGISQVAEGRAVLRRMTVLENLKMGAHIRRDQEVEKDLLQIFRKFPALGERQKQLADTLSGGEQQMLAIGRALMARPRLLLLDEPSLGLAPMVVSEIFRVLKDLKDEGKTIFLVEQNARRALQLADRGYVLARGSITLEGTGEDLLNNPEVQRSYLGRRATSEGRKESRGEGEDPF
jgi:branched-chain amino acid transport system ATP-binding protein